MYEYAGNKASILYILLRDCHLVIVCPNFSEEGPGMRAFLYAELKIHYY